MTTTPRKRVSKALKTETPAPAAPKGKLEILTALLRRNEGATIAQMSEATGWQAHSVRGAMAGSLKKKHGLTLTSEKISDVRVYHAGGAVA